MARSKGSKSSSSKSTSGRGSKAAKSSNSNTESARGSSVKASSKSDDSRIQQARQFVESNASVQTAGIALAGAGLLALVSTPAGRNLIRVATDAVVSLVSSNAESLVNAAKSSRSKSDQARV